MSSPTCREFDLDPVLEFPGKVDFTKFTSAPLTTVDKVKECKALCTNDPACGIWSVSDNTCKKFPINTTFPGKNSGLIVQPVYMYNSGFPNQTYSTVSKPTKDDCRQACKTDYERCNFFEHDLVTQVCKLNTVSSPEPTGYIKTGVQCQLMECVKGKEFVDIADDLTVTACKFNESDLKFTYYKSTNRRCEEYTYTISTDKSTLTFMNGNGQTCTFTRLGDTSIVLNVPGQTVILTINFRDTAIPPGCSPIPGGVNTEFIPAPSNACIDVFDCVRQREFSGQVPGIYTVGHGVILKFDSSVGRLFLGICRSEGCACYLIPSYTIVSNIIQFIWTDPITNKRYEFSVYNAIRDVQVTLNIDDVSDQILGTNATLTMVPIGQTRLDPNTCSLACTATELPSCGNGESYNSNNICPDRSIATCYPMCSLPSECPPNPFTSAVKFANVDDFSQKVFIQDNRNILIGDVSTIYFLRNGDVAGEYYIDTPFVTYYYSFYTVGTKKVQSLVVLSESNTVERYIEVSCYFYKKTLITPVTGSVKNIEYNSVDCSGYNQRTSAEDTILYHCLMFCGINTLKYYVLKKSTVTVLQNRDGDNFKDNVPIHPTTDVQDLLGIKPETTDFIPVSDTFDQLISPYEIVSKTDIINGTWVINPPTEELMVTLSSQIPQTLLEEYDYVDFKKYEKYYTLVNQNPGSIFSTNFIVNNDLNQEICRISEETGFSVPNNSTITKLYTARWFNRNLMPSQSDFRFVKITRKDTDQSCLVRVITNQDGGVQGNGMTGWVDLAYNQYNGYYFAECDYSGNFINDTGKIQNLVNAPNDVVMRFCFMRQRSVTNRFSGFNTLITEKGTVGEFFLYNSQLLSGVDDYNWCSTMITSGLSSTSVLCTDVYDACYKCEMTNNAVGFVYNFETNNAQMILFDEQFDVLTDRNSIVRNHDDLADQMSIYNSFYTQVQAGGVEERGLFQMVSRPEIGYDNEYGLNLFLNHNIFPSDKVSPVSLNNSGTLGERYDPSFGTLNGNVRVGSLNYETNRDPNSFINMSSSLIATQRDSRTRRVYIRSNQPNLGGKIFRGVHFTNSLPRKYTGTSGFTSTPVQINTRNSLQLTNGTTLNTFLIYRVTNHKKDVIVTTTTSTTSTTLSSGSLLTGTSGSGTSTGISGGGTTSTVQSVLNDDVNLFMIGTTDGLKRINYKYEGVGTTDEDCYWYIVKYDGFPRKMYLLSFVDRNVVIELDLTSDLVLPGDLTPKSLTVEILLKSKTRPSRVPPGSNPDRLIFAGNDTEINEADRQIFFNDGTFGNYGFVEFHRQVRNTEFSNKCKITTGSDETYCNYEYTGNSLIMYKDACNDDDKEITRVFKFYTRSNGEFDIVDLSTDTILTPSLYNRTDTNTFNRWYGAFMRFSGYRNITPVSYTPSYTALDALKAAVIATFVPPASQGNKDPLDNFMYALQFVPIVGGGGTAARSGQTAAKSLTRTTARIRPKRIPPRRNPNPDPRQRPTALSLPRGTGSYTKIIRDGTQNAPVKPTGTPGSTTTKPSGSSNNLEVLKAPKATSHTSFTPSGGIQKNPPSNIAQPASTQTPSSTNQNVGKINTDQKNSNNASNKLSQSASDTSYSVALRPVNQNRPQTQPINQLAGKDPQFIMRNWERQNVLRSMMPKIPDTPL